MIDFFNDRMNGTSMQQDPEADSVIACQVNLDKNFAFIEVCGCCNRGSGSNVLLC